MISDDRTCWLYIIRAGSTDLYKVGSSVDPSQRLRELQTGNPEELAIVGTMHTRLARAIESAFHEKWTGSSVRGEWYVFDDDQLHEVKEWIFREAMTQRLSDTQSAIFDEARSYGNEGIRVLLFCFGFILEEIAARDFDTPDVIRVLTSYLPDHLGGYPRDLATKYLTRVRDSELKTDRQT